MPLGEPPGTPAAAADPHQYRGRAWRRPLFRPPHLIDQLRSAARAHADRPAVTEVSTRGEPVRTMTYRRLWAEIENKAASIPLARAGLDRTIGVPVSNTIDSLTTVLGVIRAGAAAALVDAAEPAGRRTEMLHALNAPIARWTSDGLQLTPASAAADHATVDARTWQTAVVVFTTGSTAASKPVAQSGYAVAVNARAVARHHGLGPGVRLACPLPISHVNGLELGMFATLLSGGHAILISDFDPLHLVEALGRTNADLVTAVPSLLAVTADARPGTRLPRLRYFISAAAPLHAATAGAVWATLGKRIVQGYGLSECMNFATTMPIDLSEEAYRALVLDAAVPPVGHELPGCEVSIAADDGSAVSGAVGEICVRGHSLMSGYLANPRATAATLRDGWLRTGDLGRLDPRPDGRLPLLTITGRIKHVAKCGGLGVSLEEVERAVRRSPDVRDACCVSRPHRVLGEALSLYAVVAEGADPDLRAIVATVIDPSRVALRLIFVDTLPRLRSGKPDRVALTARAAS